MAWSMLAGLGMLFAQLTQFQWYRPPGHPLVARSYLIFDAALALSVLAVAVGGLPLCCAGPAASSVRATRPTC